MNTQAIFKIKINKGAVKEVFNARTRKELEEIDRDIKAGRNLSPGFKTVKAMRAYLEGKAHGNISSQ